MNKQVLVVDDDVQITEGLLALFETEEIAALGASDRESAEALIDGEFFPVVLADLRLHTEEEGLRLLESIRSRSPKSRIASMTAYATPELEARLKQRGASVVLHKPLGFDEILAVVSEMLAEIENEAAAQQERTGTLDLGQLYTDVQKILYAIPQKRYGFNPAEAQELVQEAWCLFLEKHHFVRLPGPWLAGTIVNLCKQQIHQRTRSRAMTQEIGTETNEIIGSNGTANDATMMVRQALGRIDERSRKLCVLIGMEGWSYEEVSGELGLPIGSVGPLYIRAKAKLRKALDVVN